MLTEIGCLYKHDKFYLNGEKYKIIGLCFYKTYNNVLCQNIETNKHIWLDQDTEVEVK